MTTNFAAALTAWKTVGLGELQRTLERDGVVLVENQKESVVGRKSLAEKTKEFRTLADADKLLAIKGLLKAYQAEIDALTRRSKTSDNAFLHVYKVLAEVPDPYPLLEAAVDQAVKVTETLEHESELAQLRHDLPLAKKRAEQLEQRIDSLVLEKVAQKAAEHDEKLRNYADREQDLNRQLTLVKTQLRDLRAANENSQARLLDHSSKQDQETVAKIAEADMIIAELDRANSRIAALEHRNEVLRAELEATRSGGETPERVKSLEAQIADLSSSVDTLSASVDTHKARLATAETLARKKADELTRELDNKTAELDNLRAQLRAMDDYDEVKRELGILKYVEFSGFEEAEMELPSPRGGTPEKSLEALLASKNKRLQEELTRFRIMHGELEASLLAAQNELTSARTELERQKELNKRLEDDLLVIDKDDSPTVDVTATDTAANNDNDKPDDDPLAGLAPRRKAQIPFTHPQPSAESSILPIVTNQRDRFRQRNAELEDELRRQVLALSELRAEIKSLQADNLALYEKVRYMQSYARSSSSSGSGVVRQLDPLPRGEQDPEIEMGKYAARYEEAMNPFEAFRGREQNRVYQNLNPAERAVLVLTRSVLGNRRARTLFVGYALALHLLVMFTVYECAHSSGGGLEPQPNPYGKGY